MKGGSLVAGIGLIGTWLRIPDETRETMTTACCLLAVVMVPMFLYMVNEGYRVAGHGGALRALNKQGREQGDDRGDERRDG